MKQIFVFSLLSLTLLSCATKKEIIYFQDADQLDEQQIAANFEPIIEPNDILYISISAPDPLVLQPFQKGTNSTGLATNTNPGLQGYLVDNKGNIRFPLLGTVHVGGKTRGEIERGVKNQLLEYITDVVVDVRIMNFKITVLGEVTNPGVFTIQDERVSLPQALGLAGDLTIDGKRSDIMVIREVDGKRQVQTIDVTSTEFFNSEFYNLKQNDVVYVQPSLKGVKKSGFIPDIPALLSLFTIVLSTVIILTR